MKKTAKKTAKKVYKKSYNDSRAHYLPEWKDLGAKIKLNRYKVGMTSQEMARQLGKSTQYYGHIEQGYNDPRTLPNKTKIALAVLLEMKYEELWGD